MCGISAIIDLQPTQSLPHDVWEMHRQIPHRGPDGEGFVCVDQQGCVSSAHSAAALHALPRTQPWRLGLGFRWLKIQDLDVRAAQPMSTPDQTLWVLLNGEIYNFRALRSELQQQGYHFRTASDTEVVLAAYQAWGTDCLRRFNGMWALVIADLRRQTVVLSRDRLGIKPLFYAVDRQRCYVASEIKQVVSALATRPAVHQRRVVDFLGGRRTQPCETTFFAGIASVPAATYAEINLCDSRPMSLTFQPYWDLAEFACAEAASPLNFVEACATFEALLSDAVTLQRTAAVSLGSLLSGGLDSSTLTALLARQGQHASFSLVFPGAGALDESPYIQAVVQRYGLRNFTTTLPPAWIHEHLPQITWMQDEPLSGPAVAAQYRVYQLAAAHGVRVMLDGQGADEILAGYPRHQLALLQEWFQAGRWGKLAHAVAHHLGAEPRLLGSFAWQAGRAVLRQLCHRPPPSTLPAWLSVEARKVLRADVSATKPPRQSREPAGLQRMLYADVHSGNLKAVLHIGDRNSMAHAIESRVPYLDHRLVEFAFQLPAAYKAGNGLRKRLLRTVAHTYLPSSVLQRRDRIGFGVPHQAWCHARFLQALRDVCRSTVVRTSPWFDQVHLETCLAGVSAGRPQDALSLWRVYALWQWAVQYTMPLS